MSYPWQYGLDDHAGYSAYGQAPQTQAHQTEQRRQQYHNYIPPQQHHMQHPMVVIPSQPRPHVTAPQFQTSPLLHQGSYPPQPQPQSQPQPTFHQSYPPVYQQQHFYPTQPQPQPQQHYFRGASQFTQQAHFQSQSAGASQQAYYTPSSQPQYSLNAATDPRNFSAGGPGLRVSDPSPRQTQYGQPLIEEAPLTSHLPSSPDPLQASPYQAPRAPPSTSSQRSPQINMPDSRPQQRNVQQPQRQQPHHPGPRHPPSQAHIPQHAPQQRVVARVEIPSHSSLSNPPALDSARPQKRRKSEDSRAQPQPVRDAPAPEKHKAPRIISQPPMSSSPLTELASSQLPPTPKPQVDYQGLLLALADEYIAAAYSMTTSLAGSENADHQTEQYHLLMATAMACLESVLVNYRQSDHRTEARLRLRLAALMIEETENYEEAEQLLGKGIALCERSKLTALKYAMHHVLVRLTYRTSPKAGLKAIDKLVQEVELLGLTHWLYCFRFLRVALSMTNLPFPDITFALKHLSAIAAHAESQQDVPVEILAAILEGIAHLRSGTNDAAELAQRSLAAARTHQLSPEMQKLPQLSALLDCLDLCCQLCQRNFESIDSKLQQMQTHLDSLARQAGWHKDGSIRVELTMTANDDLENDTCGILQRAENGHVMLPFQWITKSDLYGLAYTLSGVAGLCIHSESHKAESFLKESLKLGQQPLTSSSRSLKRAVQELDRRNAFSIVTRLQIVFALCARYEWEAAQKMLRSLRQSLATSTKNPDHDVERTMLYLEAVCRHGMGELQEATLLYSSSELTFVKDSKTRSTERDIRVLATLNNVLILRTLDAESRTRADVLIAAIEPHCQHHADKSVKAAYFTIRATAQSSTHAIMKTKQHLTGAIDAAKSASNNQLLAIVMNAMTRSLFADIIGEQAEKSARAGVQLAKKARSPLWIAVASGMYADMMERYGKPVESQAARAEAQNLTAGLPKSLLESIQRTSG